MSTLLLTDDAFLAHDTGEGHPERAERLVAIRETLEARPVPGMRWAKATPADVGAIERIHDPAYVASLLALRGRQGALDPDTTFSPGTLDATLLAAGAGLDAVRAVARGEATNAFVLVRPPGHHAEADRAMGFCFVNNVAVAAAETIASLGAKRVLLLDWDVHHGNGTQHAFEARSDVLVVDLHQWPFYPGTGALDETGRGDGAGFTVNVPLPAGCDDREYRGAMRELVRPIADRFAPDFVLVSAGFDAHRDDPLAGMGVTEEGFASFCGLAREIAERHAGGKLVLFLEGGYDLDGLAGSVRACVEVLAGATPPPLDDRPHRIAPVLDAVRAKHSQWFPR